VFLSESGTGYQPGVTIKNWLDKVMRRSYSTKRDKLSTIVERM